MAAAMTTTAMHMLQREDLSVGETIAVPGASGGVSSALMHLAKLPPTPRLRRGSFKDTLDACQFEAKRQSPPASPPAHGGSDSMKFGTSGDMPM